MKRILMMIIAMVLVVSSVSIDSLSAEIPSNWAVEEVEAAINGGLVPQILRSDYQGTVKRYEYVLLALEVLNQSDKEVVIRYALPFDDIAGHPYESEIIRAYNAGLIDGYKDGSFKPDNNISREEIATLVVNLVSTLDDQRTITQPVDYIYSDQDSIGEWARENIDYCYANEIMQGIGRDMMLRNIIDPKGITTMEQAILLVYRLAVSEGLYSANKYNNVMMGDIDDDGLIATTMLDEFARSNGYDVGDVVYELQNLSYIHLTYISDSVVELEHKDGSVLIFYNDNFIDVKLRLKDPRNYVMLNAFSDLVGIHDETLEVYTSSVNAANKFAGGNDAYYYNEPINESYKLLIHNDSYNLDEETIDLGYVFRVLEIEQ